MPDDGCDCCGATHSGDADGGRNTHDGTADDARDADPDAAGGRLLTDTPFLHAPLPGDVRATLGRFLGAEPVGTLGEWVGEVRKRTGGAVTVGDLCHATGETDHWGRTDGETHHFECFYDAVVLSALTESPVDVHTVSPDGTVVEATATGTTGLTATPPEAVFSFGVAENVEPPSSGGPTHEDVYAAVCPYVRAFPNPRAYKQWAATVPAATVAAPLSGATELAAELVE